jgi:ribA/ribD-fused uncharacterized protein
MIKEFQGEFRFLSNFAPSPIVYNGAVYKTGEHLYQALKAADEKDHINIRFAPHAGAAKKLGKTITVREDWDVIKDDIMKTVVSLKFKQNPKLAAKLLATGDQELQEGNWWGDVHFGISLKTGEGQNVLGKILVEVRSELKMNVLDI